MNWDLDLVRMGERLKEKEMRLSRLKRPTAVGRGKEERTTTGRDHLFKWSTTERVRMAHSFVMTTPDEEQITTLLQ